MLSIVTFLTMVINKIQGLFIQLFQINRMVNHWSIISAPNFIVLKTFNLKFLYIELWFTDKNSRDKRDRDKITRDKRYNKLSFRY